MIQKFYTLLFCMVFVGGALMAQPITITDGSINAGDNVTWTKDNIYLLDGFVFVEAGATLTIEAGTVIYGKENPSTTDNASALIITRGAQIFANGTEEEPIVFTSELAQTTDLTANDRGLWGGLIILGNGVLANTTPETRIEGIPEGEDRALFGGDDDTDNSGSLSYVSIRHGGAELSPGDEINGLTLGGVGSGTNIDHVEVIANVDDGIEFFGGTVSIKFATVAFCGDDQYDWDLGWRGNGQFWFALIGDDDGDNGGELDGAKPDEGEPTSNPTIYNATFIGAGCNATASNNTGMLFRDGSAGTVQNSILTGFKFGIEVEDRASGLDSRQRLENGELVVGNSLWFDFCTALVRPTEDAEDPTAQWLIDSLLAAGNTLDNPNLTSISRTDDNMLDPRPAFGGAAFGESADLPDDEFFQVANFKGAFGGTLWLRGWTALDEYGHLPEAGQSIVIKDSDINAGETVTLFSENEYILDGFVFVEDGATITIEAGTVIKGRETPSNNDNASALIISRGGKIFANGTEDAPIIMTTEFDDVTDPSDLTANDRGLWGGLIILGKARIANTTPETRIEGIPEGEPRALFGGDDDTDNSGSLSYVSIRHGGAELAPGDEINGLTLGGVGSGTSIDHVEVIANQDDGIEFFGGTVSIKFASVSFCGDDQYDWDLGWRGNGQFWLALLGDDDGDNGGELDGAKPDEGEPTSNPTIYNATFIGAGCNSTASNNTGMLFRDGSAGTVQNSIVTGFKNGIEVEDRASGLDSRQRLENGELVIGSSLWYDFCTGLIRLTDDGEQDEAWLLNNLLEAGNTTDDAMLAGISRTDDMGFDPRPQFGGPAYSGTADLPDDDFFQVANYKGAFSGDLWLRGWTALDEYGHLAEEAVPGDCSELVTINDASVNAGETLTLTNDECYLLDGFVFVEDGATINIEAGTVIKGKEAPSNNDNASALIIARGGTINAEGTADLPIIFTTEFDDVTDPSDLGLNDRGFWGGLIILGEGVLANTTAETRIEGIPEGEPRALFGGTNDEDNSGVLKFVSIRHGGAELAPGDEINGLTLGGVGSGTTIENVEVLANQDDGIEFFGGTVSIKYATVGFCGDDSFDWDLGWRGNGQFWLAIHGDDDGDNGGELDGAKPDEGEPTSSPTIYNATFIGAGCSSTASNNTGMLFRDGSAGYFANGIITGYKFGIEVEDRASGLDSRQRMEDGELVVGNNIWWDFCNGEELNAGANGFLRATDDAEDPTAQFLIEHLAAEGNSIVNHGMTISRTDDGMFNPLPGDDARNAPIRAIPDDPFFTNVCFAGAFGPNGGSDKVWIQGWTALAAYGMLNPGLTYGTYDNETSCVTSIDDLTIGENGYELTQNRPNPFFDNTIIEFTLPQKAEVTLSVYDVYGKEVSRVINNDSYGAGSHTVEFNADNLSKGIYFYTLRSENVILTRQMMIVK